MKEGCAKAHPSFGYFTASQGASCLGRLPDKLEAVKIWFRIELEAKHLTGRRFAIFQVYLQHSSKMGFRYAAKGLGEKPGRDGWVMP